MQHNDCSLKNGIHHFLKSQFSFWLIIITEGNMQV